MSEIVTWCEGLFADVVWLSTIYGIFVMRWIIRKINQDCQMKFAYYNNIFQQFWNHSKVL